MFKKVKLFLVLVLIVFVACPINIVSADSVKTVTVAMATDNNYVIPTILSITSLAKSADLSTNYKIYILYSNDISQESKNDILSLEKTYNNCTINFINMGEDFESSFVPSWYTKAIYYRLRLPSLLSKESRCIYIDVDTIIPSDLWQLFKTDMGGCYVGGVKDIVVRQIDDKEYLNLLNFKNPCNYINSGVLLMDLERMRKDGIEEKFDNFINEKNKAGIHLKFPDQDVINCVCQDRIYYLPCKYNMMVTIVDLLTMYSDAFNIKKFDEHLCFEGKDWSKGLETPAIIHYAGPFKPWKNLNVQMASKWWEFVDNIELRQKILKTYNLKIK